MFAPTEFHEDPAGLPMAERLARAASRLDPASTDPSSHHAVAFELRPDQARVRADLARFLRALAASDGRSAPRGHFGRVVLPPRTGKTVVAADMIARSGLRTTFIVPTRTLVDQTAAELTARLPGLPVGTYFSDRKSLVAAGVNVTTYSILLRDHAAGAVPAPIAGAALVFADEAHRAMSASRMSLLRSAFAPRAVRVALTATPDYDDDRVLCRHFPRLIHEVTAEEAMALGLLAPARLWVAEVDAAGSTVTIAVGEYDDRVLGRVMSEAPFARAVEVYRYDGANRALPAMIACVSRQQAHDLRAYLSARPRHGAPPPALILGDTPAAERVAALADFEAGRIDTLIQVGVLIEGWNSPRCKLLIDLAPTLSRVRATQKYYRVMTRDGDHEARIVVLLPRDLPEPPVLPFELFGASTRYACGDLLGELVPNRVDPRPVITDGAPVEGVKLLERVVLTGRVVAPRLDRDRPDDVRAVLASCRAFDAGSPCGLGAFRRLGFEHPLFTGRGEFLLRWLRVAPTTAAFAAWLTWIYPDGGAARLLLDDEHTGEWPSCDADAQHLMHALTAEGAGRDEDFADGWRALAGADGVVDGQAFDPLERLVRREEAHEVARLVFSLKPSHLDRVVRLRGLWGERPQLVREIAEEDQLSRPRVGQIDAMALRRLRSRFARKAGVLRIFEPILLPPALQALATWHREHGAWARREYRRLCPHGWTTLLRPMPVRELLQRLSPFLVALRCSDGVFGDAIDERTWASHGVMWAEARWESGDVRVRCQRQGHAAMNHEGDEVEELALRVEVTGLPRDARLLLSGPIGEIDAFKVEGDDDGAIENRWRALEGLSPRPRKRRSRRLRSSQRW